VASSSTVLLYGIRKVVIGENRTVKGLGDYVRNRGEELDLRDDAQCKQLMQDFIAQQPALWNEDIGE
jgi:creatinine deaminase